MFKRYRVHCCQINSFLVKLSTGFDICSHSNAFLVCKRSQKKFRNLIANHIFFIIWQRWCAHQIQTVKRYTLAGSAKANGREPKSCLGRVFNFKLGHFVLYAITQHIQKHALA
jgi:hypothetical protein